MRTATSGSNWQQAVVVLTGTVVFAVVVATLYWAQPVLIPVATAIFLTFLLSPPMMALQRRGLGRIPSVIIVVFSAGLLLTGLGWLVKAQVESLAAALPQHQTNIKLKFNQVRQWTRGGLFEELRDLIDKITHDPATDKAAPVQTVAPDSRPPTNSPAAPPPSEVAQSSGPIDFGALWGALGPVLSVVGGVALAAVLVVFMLVKREDLRNRLIRLVGHGRITTTTKAVDDAAQRVSRFLLMQLIVNGTYGLTFAAGLFVLGWFDLGVPYAILWGFLAAVLRYVPYIGAWFAAVLPIMLSLAVNPGWGAPLAIVLLVLVLELISNNVMEPWLYGQSIGVSEVALLIAAAFWTFLWGPIGLVLSAPLTVCLVVLGKYVPRLEFLDVLLGDAPALQPRLAFYQRLLARDQDEAAEVVDDYAKDHPPEEVYDDLLINALNFVKRDRGHDDLTAEDEQMILEALTELGDDLVTADTWSAAGPSPTEGRKTKLLACPARDAVDEAALRLLAGSLDPKYWDVDVVALNLLSSELLSHIETAEPDVLCLAALPPGGLAHTRYLCKRLRQRISDLKIIVGRWGLSADHVKANREALSAVGADHVGVSLAETRRWLQEWRPVFESDAPATESRPRDRVAAGV